MGADLEAAEVALRAVRDEDLAGVDHALVHHLRHLGLDIGLDRRVVAGVALDGAERLAVVGHRLGDGRRQRLRRVADACAATACERAAVAPGTPAPEEHREQPQRWCAPRLMSFLSGLASMYSRLCCARTARRPGQQLGSCAGVVQRHNAGRSGAFKHPAAPARAGHIGAHLADGGEEVAGSELGDVGIAGGVDGHRGEPAQKWSQRG